MTDITDQEKEVRRIMQQMQGYVNNEDWYTGRPAEWLRDLREVFPASAPTLSEDLAHITEHWEEWATEKINTALTAATDSAKQMEHDLAEAREALAVEGRRVEKIAKERDEARAENLHLDGIIGQREAELVDLKESMSGTDQEWEEDRKELRLAQGAVKVLNGELMEARAEVERLTAEREYWKEYALERQRVVERLVAGESAATVAREANVAPDQQANTQGILAGSLPDPADVKPGELWLISVRGREAVAVRDGHEVWPWSVAFIDGETDDTRDDVVTPLHRLVPAPRVITNPDELEHLAATSIIRDGRGWPGGITDQGVTMINGFCLSDEEVLSHGPVTVLWEPGA